MISISNYSGNYNIYSKSFCGTDVSDIVSRADKALNEGKYSEALEAYQEAQNKNPDDFNLYRKLGKANFHLKNYKTAEENFDMYLKRNPDDSECLIELGETQRHLGKYDKAIKTFEYACELDATNDLAKRSKMTAENDLLATYSPEKAKQEKIEYARKNLKEALDLSVKFMGAEYMSKLKDVNIYFGKTDEMGGTSNIAQYSKKTPKSEITVSDSYIYAAPQVIAAYISHEAVHAHDDDAYTSVREEQDAYEVAAKFWLKHSKGIKDPEMDYAAELYKKSPSSLKNRVEEIYTLRDPDIAKTSPHHPPSKIFKNFNSKTKAASKGLKEYNFIA